MFGGGVYTGDSLQSIKNGQNNTKGQFYGKKHGSGNASISIFHIENLYGFVWKRINGFINNKGKYLLKMTPNNIDKSQQNDYNWTGTGYINVNVMFPSGRWVSVKNMKLIQSKGLVPLTTEGASTTTYYCDTYFWLNVIGAPKFGGAFDCGLGVGVFALQTEYTSTTATAQEMVCLSFK